MEADGVDLSVVHAIATNPKQMLFGSDCPWHRPAWELRLLDSLELGPEDRERILWKNAAKLLGGV